MNGRLRSERLIPAGQLAESDALRGHDQPGHQIATCWPASTLEFVRGSSDVSISSTARVVHPSPLARLPTPGAHAPSCRAQGPLSGAWTRVVFQGQDHHVHQRCHAGGRQPARNLRWSPELPVVERHSCLSCPWWRLEVDVTQPCPQPVQS